MDENIVENIELQSSVPIKTPAFHATAEPEHNQHDEDSQEYNFKGNLRNIENSSFIACDADDIQELGSESLPALPALHAMPETAQEKARKNSLIRKISQYKSIFGAELVELDLRNLYMRSLDELEELGDTVEFLVSTRRSVKAAQAMFLGGVNVCELMAPKIGMDLTGLTVLTAKSSEILETVTEVSIKYSENIQVDPIHRLGLHMIQLALAVNDHNKKLKAEKLAESPQQNMIPNEQIPESMQESPPEIQAIPDPDPSRREKLMEGL
jgi:hypothetical protein